MHVHVRGPVPLSPRAAKPQKLGTTGVGDQATYDPYAIARNILIFSVFDTQEIAPYYSLPGNTIFRTFSALCFGDIRKLRGGNN